MKVAVLSGGRSLERVVSLSSGARVADALGSLGHEAVLVDPGPELVSTLRDADVEVAFIALHGPGGEDGTIQELLELLGIPYTGPGVAACMSCFDKVTAKHRLRAAGVPTPDWVALTGTAFRELGAAEMLGEIEARIGFPMIAKPAAQGSSLGVKLVPDADAVPQALVAAFSYDERVLLETFATGRELAVAVIDGEALPIVEAQPKSGAEYDFEARYEIGRTDYVCPAELDPDALDACNAAALGAWAALGCEGFVRTDLILTAEGPQVLEVNAVPGLTDTSLFPMAAEAAGIDFEAFVARALELALGRA